jgi:hypothetical protein
MTTEVEFENEHPEDAKLFGRKGNKGEDYIPSETVQYLVKSKVFKSQKKAAGFLYILIAFIFLLSFVFFGVAYYKVHHPIEEVKVFR